MLLYIYICIIKRIPGCTVTDSVILSLGDLDQHLGSGVLDGYGLEDRRTVVGDSDTHVFWIGYLL